MWNIENFINKNELSLKQKFESKWYDWEKIKEKLRKVKINENLDNLEKKVNWNYDELYKRLIELMWGEGKIEDARQTSVEQTKSLQTNVTETVKNTKDSAEQTTISAWEKAIMEKAEKLKNIPLIWGTLYDMASGLVSNIRSELEEKPEDSGWWEKVMRKLKIWFATFILWMFGIKNVRDQLNSSTEQVKEWTENLVNNAWEAVNNIVQEVKQWDDKEDLEKSEKKEENSKKEEDSSVSSDEEKKDELKEVNEIERKLPEKKMHIWFKALLSLSWENLDKNQEVYYYVDWLQNISYKNFLESYKNDDFKRNVLNLWKADEYKTGNNYELVTKWFASQNVQDLLRISLKKETLKRIFLWQKFDKENEKLKSELWEKRFKEILEMIKNDSYDYRDLTVWELSILYLYSFPAISSGILNSLWWNIINDISSLFWDIDIKGLLDSEMPLNKELCEKILKFEGGKNEIINLPKEELVKRWGISENTEAEKDIEKLLEFKSKLGNILNARQFDLSQEEKSQFLDHMNYKDILALYITTWWELNVDNMNWITLISVLMLIANTIWRTNNFFEKPKEYWIYSKFIQSIGKTLVTWSEDIFTEDQKIVLKIYSHKLLGISEDYVQKHMAKVFWFVWADNFWKQEWFLLWTAWVSHYLKKGLDARYVKAISQWKMPLWMPWIGRFLVVTKWASIAGALYNITLNGKDLSFEGSKRLDSELNKDNLNIGDYSKINDMFMRWNRILQMDIVENNKNKTKEIWFSAINWDSPIIIIDWKKYFLRIIDKSAWAFFNETLNFIPGIEQKDIENSNWKSYQPIVVDWDYIVFWKAIKMPITQVLSVAKKEGKPELLKDALRYANIPIWPKTHYYKLNQRLAATDFDLWLFPIEEQ